MISSRLLVASLFSALALASGVARGEPRVSLYGTLKGFDASTVKILLESGSIAVVPRSSLSVPVDGMISGKAKVTASVGVTELMKLNPALAKLTVDRPDHEDSK